MDSSLTQESPGRRDIRSCAISQTLSSYTWLDRLRAAKGFPADPHIALEDYVSSLQPFPEARSPAVDSVTSSNGHGCKIETVRRKGEISEDWELEMPAVDDKREVGTFPCSFHSVKLQAPRNLSLDVMSESGSFTKSTCSRFSKGIHHMSKNFSERKLVSVVREGTDHVCSIEHYSTATGNAPRDNSGDLNYMGTFERQSQSTVFADLFGMRDLDTHVQKIGLWNHFASVKKHQRKQERPRLWPSSYESLKSELEAEGALDAHCFRKVDLHSAKQHTSVREQTVEASVEGMAKLGCNAMDSSTISYLSRAVGQRSACSQLEEVAKGRFPVMKSQDSSSASHVSTQDCKEGPRGANGQTMLANAGGALVSKGCERLHCGVSDSEDGFVCNSGKLKAGSVRKRMLSSSSQVQGHTSKRRMKVSERGSRSNSRKREVTSDYMDGTSKNVYSSQLSTMPSAVDAQPLHGFAADHPASQPEGSLTLSIYQVFFQAGKTGLTAREAVTKILEKGLPGLHEGGVVPRVQVGKFVRSSPYFIELEESKFVLCSAIVSNENENGVRIGRTEKEVKVVESRNAGRQPGNWQYLAVLAALRRARTSKTRSKETSEQVTSRHIRNKEPINNARPFSQICKKGLKTMNKEPVNNARPFSQIGKKGLKTMKQDGTGLGNPCNRSDGKGWHCPLLAKVGYLLCDHHLDKLRSKNGSRPRKRPPNTVKEKTSTNWPSDEVRSLKGTCQ